MDVDVHRGLAAVWVEFPGQADDIGLERGWVTFVVSSLDQADDFARMAAQLLAERYEQPTLNRIVELAVQTVDSCDHCSISLLEPGGELTVAASTDPIAEKVMTLHAEFSEGPVLDATSDLGAISVDDVTGDRRWPRWGLQAAALGVKSMLVIQLTTARQSQVATLNLFAARPHAFDTTDLAVAGIFARLAATAVDVARQDEGLRAAARSRQVIGVAQGMLMQRFGLTLDQSFELLRRYSRDRNVKLRVLAERLAEIGIPSVGDAADNLERVFGLDPDDRSSAVETR